MTMKSLYLCIVLFAAVFTQGLKAAAKTNIPGPLTNTLSLFKVKGGHPHFQWDTDVTTSRQKGEFLLDFHSSDILIGLKKKGAVVTSTWGITECKENEGCVIKKEEKESTGKFMGKDITYWRGELAIAPKTGFAISKDHRAQVKFLKDVKGEFVMGTKGVLGLGPESTFWAYLKAAFKWQNDYVQVEFVTDQPKIKAKRFSDEISATQGYLKLNLATSGDTKKYNTLTKIGTKGWNLGEIKFDKKKEEEKKKEDPKKEDPKKEDPKKKRLLRALQGTTTTNLLFSGKACVAPEESGFIIFKDVADEKRLTEHLFNELCGSKTQCPSKSDFTKVHSIFAKFDKIGTFEISPLDILAKGETNYNKGFRVGNAAFFSTTCTGTNFALGRNFFARFGLIIRTKSTGVATFEYSLDYKEPEGFPSSYMKYLVVGGLLLLLLIPLTCYCMNRSKKRAELEDTPDKQ